jgi:hypothetical protein
MWPIAAISVAPSQRWWRAGAGADIAAPVLNATSCSVTRTRVVVDSVVSLADRADPASALVRLALRIACAGLNAELVMADLSLRNCRTPRGSSGSVRAPDELVMFAISATDEPSDRLRINRRVKSDPKRLRCLL